MFLQLFFASVDNSQLKMRRAGPVTFYTTRASVWVPSGVDRIVRLPSNHQFFRQNHHIKNSFVWQCYYQAQHNYNDEGNKKIKKATGLINRTKTLHMQHTFWQISLHLLHEIQCFPQILSLLNSIHMLLVYHPLVNHHYITLKSPVNHHEITIKSPLNHQPDMMI